MRQVDVAVVGGGIVGLAHAWAAARRGLSVALFERDPRAEGASVRNFGMVWPVGQPPGADYDRAVRSRARWLELADRAGVWVNRCGSLHLARRPDELAVLEEFAARAGRSGVACEVLTADAACAKSPAVRRDGLLGALWSPVELCVDPREAVALLPQFLTEAHGVRVLTGEAVARVEPRRLWTAAGREWRADRVIVCSGADFRTLFPEVYAAAGVRRCKLQMMRTGPQPGGWRIGPHLAGGLTLCHYAAFRECPSLPALRARIDREHPEFVRFGIHVMASQNGLGEVVIGDSHQYDGDATPFDNPRIDALILEYLQEMVELPDPGVAGRWHGVYAKHPTVPLFAAEPLPGAHVVGSPGGAGMTLSFGWADELWDAWTGGAAACPN